MHSLSAVLCNNILCVCVCDVASEEQYECVPDQSKCCVNVPPYTSGPTDTVSEDWDEGTS